MSRNKARPTLPSPNRARPDAARSDGHEAGAGERSPRVAAAAWSPIRWRLEMLVAALAVATYLNAPFNGFAHDDGFIVAGNPQVTEPGKWLESWSTDVWSVSMGDWSARDLLYRPLALNSFRLVWWMSGGRAGAQIAVNVLLHALACALLVRVMRHWGLSSRAALIGGVAFAVWPIHVEAVSNAVGRADSLATVFVLLTLLAQRRAGGFGWSALSAMCALCAMASKESGVAAVAAVMIWEFLGRPTRARVAAAGSDAARASSLDAAPTDERPAAAANWARRVVGVAPHAIAAALYLCLRYHALDGQWRQPEPATRGANLLAEAVGFDRILGATQLWGMYWVKTFWPAVLGIGYGENAVRLATSPVQFHVVLGAAVLLGLAAWSGSSWRRGDRVPAAVALMLVAAYAPTSNLLFLLRVYLAERIWYLPSLFLAAIAGMALEGLSRSRVVSLIMCCAAAGMMARCWLRTPEWHDNGTLYAAAFRDQPESSHVLNLYGDWLVRHGEYQRGVELLRRSIAIHLGRTEAYRSLGWAHLHYGNVAEAVRILQIANLQVPGHAGIAAMLEKATDALAARTQAEIEALRTTADAATHDLASQIALLDALRRTGRLAEAQALAAARDADFADQPRWHASIAALMIYANRRDEAAARYERSIELAPGDAQVTTELGMLLLERRAGDDLARARALSLRAMELAPNSPTVWIFRAETLAIHGDRAGARALYEKAIKALPPDSPQRAMWAQRARTLGG